MHCRETHMLAQKHKENYKTSADIALASIENLRKEMKMETMSKTQMSSGEEKRMVVSFDEK